MSLERRRFLALGGAALAAKLTLDPPPAQAQRTLPVIGFLHSVSANAYADNATAFASGLSQEGFVEAQSLAVEYRFADGQFDRLGEMAADLARHGVALIVAGGMAAMKAAAAATTTIPIVFVTGADPVASGLITNLKHPDGNLTGVTFITAGLSDEKLALISQMVPKAQRIGYLGEAPVGDEATARRIGALKSELTAAAGRRGFQVIAAAIDRHRNYEGAFASFESNRADAIVIAPSMMFANDADDVVGAATAHEIPTVYPRRADVVAGGLMSYGARIADVWRNCGVQVGRVLKGIAPADLPVVGTSSLELVINRAVANALDLTIPASLLSRADDIVE